MTRPREIVRLGDEVHSQLDLLSPPYTAAMRAIRRALSGRLANAAPESVIRLALYLLERDSDLVRVFSYEMVHNHRLASQQLTTADLQRLGKGLSSWPQVDTFAMYLSGPMWAQGRLADKTVRTWARSRNTWWRRTALVSTVPLSRRGDPADFPRVEQICALLVADRDDLVVKALSWALREAAKKHPEQVRTFLERQKNTVAARVRREVNNKLRTGLKAPPSRAR